MALPSNPIRNWLVRLQALNRPRTWGVGLGLGLLAVVSYQYGTHPEWLSLFERASEGPTRPGSANLSDQELAELAEIDNLELLLNQLQPLTASTLTTEQNGAPESGNLLETLQQAQPNSEGDSPQITPQSPFAAYLERTQFNVSEFLSQETVTANSDSANPSRDELSGRPLEPLPAISSQAALSPLQQALAQSGGGNFGSSANILVSPGGEEAQASTTATSVVEPSAATTAPGLTPPPWVVEGSIPGVNQRFIRTTPEMSPPPGTTGYTVPSTLQTSGSGSLSTSILPQPAPIDLNLGPVPPATTSIPGAGANPPGTVLPPALNNSYDLPRSQPEVAPFSVPRPPGSHTGGGYIYTFSNPNGP
jgi:hypothetical protein